MLPASNRGAGMNICAPDVCATPPAGAPVPYVNMGLNAAAVPFAVKTYLSCVNALNQGSIVPLTLGDQSGAMSPFMGPGTITVGNPKIFIEGLPGTNLGCPATGNNMVAMGASLVPSVTNVFFTYSADATEARLGAAALADPDLLSALAEAVAPAAADHGQALLLGDMAYIRVPVFTFAVAGHIHVALQRFEATRALVLDLRGCPGGELAAAIDLASDFLPEGTLLATVTDADGDDTDHRSRREHPYTVPVIVLVDRDTASAAEVFAGCLQAHGRALVAGERTFGKGLVQRVVAGSGAPGSAAARAAYATVAAVTLPNGIALQGRGIQPDVELG